MPIEFVLPAYGRRSIVAEDGGAWWRICLKLGAAEYHPFPIASGGGPYSTAYREMAIDGLKTNRHRRDRPSQDNRAVNMKTFSRISGAQGGIRTPTSLRTLEPESSASASSATWAHCAGKAKRFHSARPPRALSTQRDNREPSDTRSGAALVLYKAFDSPSARLGVYSAHSPRPMQSGAPGPPPAFLRSAHPARREPCLTFSGPRCSACS
jgi:hypothetical protein